MGYINKLKNRYYTNDRKKHYINLVWFAVSFKLNHLNNNTLNTNINLLFSIYDMKSTIKDSIELDQVCIQRTNCMADISLRKYSNSCSS